MGSLLLYRYLVIVFVRHLLKKLYISEIRYNVGCVVTFDQLLTYVGIHC